jgi:NagD protein
VAPALSSAARQLGYGSGSWPWSATTADPDVPMARRGRALAVAVGTGLGAAGAFAGLPEARRPHLLVRGVDERLSLCRAAYQ